MPLERHKFVIGLILCCLLFMSSAGTVDSASGSSGDSGQATAQSRALQLEQAAESLYGNVLKGDVMKVRQETEAISRLFVSSSFEGLTTVEGINALSGVILDLKAAVAAAEISQERWETAAVRLRLAANSLAHPRQPMWEQYYKLFREDMNQLEKSASVRDLAGWKASVQSLQNRYDNIRPAVIISRSPEAVNAFDSWLSYAAGIPSLSTAPDRARLLEIVSYGQEALRVLFGKEREEPVLSLPMAPEQYGAWGMLAAGFILAVLGYAGYRKYRAENENWRPV
ncbi:sporulation protein YpjB [Paenibacillus sp. sgz500958]|uniref:sporulation protein YpjB n=1 Tax=Paenibacillus sp. sgz500958 TaxID=3242475 RepID=UPI0036D37F86